MILAQIFTPSNILNSGAFAPVRTAALTLKSQHRPWVATWKKNEIFIFQICVTVSILSTTAIAPLQHPAAVKIQNNDFAWHRDGNDLCLSTATTNLCTSPGHRYVPKRGLAYFCAAWVWFATESNVQPETFHKIQKNTFTKLFWPDFKKCSEPTHPSVSTKEIQRVYR